MATDFKGVSRRPSPSRPDVSCGSLWSPERISDEEALWMARDVAKKVEVRAHLSRPDQGHCNPRDPCRGIRSGDQDSCSSVTSSAVQAGRKAVHDPAWSRLVDRERIDFVIANVENAAGAVSGSPRRCMRGTRFGLPVDVWTSGNHIWDKKEGVPVVGRPPERCCAQPTIPTATPAGDGALRRPPPGVPVAVVNLQGQALMAPIDNPFRRRRPSP